MDDPTYAFNYPFEGEPDSENNAYSKATGRDFTHEAYLSQEDALIGLSEPYTEAISQQESQNTAEIQFDDNSQSQGHPNNLASGTSTDIDRSSQSFTAGSHSQLPYHFREPTALNRLPNPSGNDAGPWTPFEPRVSSEPGAANFRQPTQSATDTDSGYVTYPPKASTGSAISGQAGPDFNSAIRGTQVSPYQANSSSRRIEQDIRSTATHQSMDDQSMTGFSNSGNLYCATCNKHFQNNTDYKKHASKHNPQHFCKQPGCARQEGFTTKNDLLRHAKTVHKIVVGRYWKCFYPACQKAEKLWPRLDNFKAHIIRMHGGQHAEEFVRQAEEWWEAEEDSKGSVNYTQGSHGTVHPSELQSVTDGTQHDTQSIDLFHPAARYAQSEMGGNKRKRGFDRPTLLYRPDTSNTHSLHDTNKRRRSAVDANTAARVFKGGFTPSMAVPVFLPNPGSSWDQYSFHHQTLPNESAMIHSPVSHIQPHSDYRAQSTKSHPHRPHTVIGDVGYTQSELMNETYSNIAPDRTGVQPSSHDELTGIGGATFASDYSGSVMDTNQNMADIELQSATDIHPAAVSLDYPPELTLQQMLRMSDEDKTSIIQLLQSTSSTTQDSRSVISTNFSVANADARKQHQCSKMIQHPGGIKRCPKTFDRGNELRKHEARHDRRFACTYDNCYKRFGSKWEWRRHEQKQHEQAEVWRCDRGPPHRSCMKIFHDKEEFRDHLQRQHKPNKRSPIEEMINRCRVAKRFQGPYWCGFCRAIKKNDAPPGPDREKARYDHIGAHIEDTRKMDYWVALEAGAKTRGELQNASFIDLASTGESFDSDIDSDPAGEDDSSSPDQTPVHVGNASMEHVFTGPDKSLRIGLERMDLDPNQQLSPMSFQENLSPMPNAAQHFLIRSHSYTGGDVPQGGTIRCCQCAFQHDYHKVTDSSRCCGCNHVVSSCKNCFKFKVESESTGLDMGHTGHADMFIQ